MKLISKALQSQTLERALCFALILLTSAGAVATAQEETRVDNYQAWSLSDYESGIGETLSSFSEAPPLTKGTPGHYAACHFAAELELAGVTP